MTRWFDLPQEIRERVYRATRFQHAKDRLDKHINLATRCRCEILQKNDFPLSDDKLMRFYKATDSCQATCVVFCSHTKVKLHEADMGVKLQLSAVTECVVGGCLAPLELSTLPSKHSVESCDRLLFGDWFLARSLDVVRY